jgi:hypothetical protein
MSATPNPVAAPAVTAEEWAGVHRLLRDTEAEFLALLSSITDEQWSYKPAHESWSVQEAAAHLVLAEMGLLAKVHEALAAPPNPDWEEQTGRKTALLERVLPVAMQKAQAPDPVRPRELWSRDETIARFREARAATQRFAAQTGRPMRDHTAEHPFPVFNTLSAWQWLLYIPLHQQRHCRQIAGILEQYKKGEHANHL